MQSLLFLSIVWFFIFLSVYARSIDKIGSNSESNMAKQSADNKFLSKYFNNYSKHRQFNDDDITSSSSTDEEKELLKRDFFLFPRRRSSQRYRPIYSYGRKSHWDTFFGKK